MARNIWTDNDFMLTVSCAKGVMPALKQELNALGYPVLDGSETMVGVKAGGVRDILNLNMRLRTAQRILWPFFRGKARNLDDLYRIAANAPWEDVLDPDTPFRVESMVWNETVRDTRMPNLKCKDAIADRMRAKWGRRPDVSRESGAAVFIHWESDALKCYIDTTGVTLSRRGYRMNPWKAPLQESLAAACLILSGWDQKSPMVVPFCGSGTPAIEAALMAKNVAPGLLRSHFAFMSLKGWQNIIPGEKAGESVRQRFGATPEQIWKHFVTTVRNEQRQTDALPPIVASDIDEGAIAAAESNAMAAGVREMITFQECDFAKTDLPVRKGFIFMNPEYGERLGEEEELAPVYARIGEWLKTSCPGWKASLITASKDLSLQIKLKTSSIYTIYNGPLPCRLLSYEIASGEVEK